jgi:drug/metabolite transporter (DMT)-like permease
MMGADPAGPRTGAARCVSNGGSEGGAAGNLPRTDMRGLAALCAGGAAIGFAPIGIRLADVSPTASAFWRLALAAAVLWPAAAALARRAGAPRSMLSPAILLTGLFFAADLGAWHISVAWTSVANATLEANFAPVFVTLAGWVLFRQPVTGTFLAALAITLCGAAVLISPNFAASGRGATGDALGCLTAVFYAGYMLAVKAASRRASTLDIAFAGTTIAAIVVLPYALFTADRFWPQSASGWLVLAALALVAHAGGQTLIAYGLSRVPAALGSVTLLIQPIMAALYAGALLGEHLGMAQFAGGAIVLLGIWLAQRSSR